MTRLRSEREEFWTPDNFPFDLIFYEPKKGCRHWREVREGDMTREEIEAAIQRYMEDFAKHRAELSVCSVILSATRNMLRRAFGLDGGEK